MPSMKRKRIPSNPMAMTTFKKRKNNSVASVNRVPRTLREFPAQMRVKLKYCAIFNAPVVSTAAGGVPGYAASFRANSCFDPDTAIGGSSATGFAQWSNFYQRYTVVGSTMTLRILDQDTGTAGTGTINGLCGITIRDTASPVVVPNQTALITDADAVHTGWDSWHAAAKLTKSFNTSKYFGVENLLDNNELGGGTGNTLGSNPGREAFYYMWISQAPGAGAAAQATLVEVYITYDVIFSVPADL